MTKIKQYISAINFLTLNCSMSKENHLESILTRNKVVISLAHFILTNLSVFKILKYASDIYGLILITFL